MKEPKVHNLALGGSCLLCLFQSNLTETFRFYSPHPHPVAGFPDAQPTNLWLSLQLYLAKQAPVSTYQLAELI